MPDLDYFRHHLFGAWRLLRGDETGFDHFDTTEEGFWRSFWALGAAIILTIPLSVADHRLGTVYAEQVEGYAFAAPLSIFLAAEFLTSVVGLIVYLLLMVPFLRAFGVAERYGTFVVAYNWASLLIVLLSLPLSIAGFLGWLSWEAVLPFELVLSLIFLVYSWFIASVALNLSRLDAAAVVALELLVILALGYPVGALYDTYLV